MENTRQAAAFQRGKMKAELIDTLVDTSEFVDRDYTKARDQRNPHSKTRDPVSHEWWNKGFDSVRGDA